VGLLVDLLVGTGLAPKTSLSGSLSGALCGPLSGPSCGPLSGALCGTSVAVAARKLPCRAISISLSI